METLPKAQAMPELLGFGARVLWEEPMELLVALVLLALPMS